MSEEAAIIRRLPAPFSIRDVEQYITRHQRLRFYQNPSRIAGQLVRTWQREGIIRPASKSVPVPRYWGVL